MYILRLLCLARMYGVRANPDLHTIPGSQNGRCFVSSGANAPLTIRFRVQPLWQAWLDNCLSSVMGLVNAERSLGYTRFVVKFVSQPELRAVVPMVQPLRVEISVLLWSVVAHFAAAIGRRTIWSVRSLVSARAMVP